jgi:hypothetical protein
MDALTRFGVVVGMVVTAACGGGETNNAPPTGEPVAQRMITDDNIAAFRVWTVDTLSTPICVAHGYDDCPLRAAFANGLGDGRVAVWEPGRRVLVLGADGAMTAVGDSASPLTVAAITGDGRGFRAVVVDDTGWQLVELDRAGKETRRQPLPAASPRNIVGFVGQVPVAQRIADIENPAGGRLEVDRLNVPTDSAGTRLLGEQVSWLREVGGFAMPAPLFAALPLYTVGEDGSIAWTPGQRFEIEARDRNGKPRWRLLGPSGPEITEEEYAVRLSEAKDFHAATPLAESDYEQMRAQAPKTHAAVSALVRSGSGVMYVGGSQPLAADSITWFRLSAAGEPTGRFTLSAQTRVIYARNDSLLVHRPTEGEPWEVRWIRLLPPE